VNLMTACVDTDTKVFEENWDGDFLCVGVWCLIPSNFHLVFGVGISHTGLFALLKFWVSC